MCQNSTPKSRKSISGESISGESISGEFFPRNTTFVWKWRVSSQSMLGPLPEVLRIGVYQSYDKRLYGQFMRCVVALQEGTISVEVADADVFTILGYDGGQMNRGPGYQPSRDASSKSNRPDLYRIFVEWSTTVLPVAKDKKKNRRAIFFRRDKHTLNPPSPKSIAEISD